MGIKKFKPTTHSLRFTIISDFAEITKSTPEKSLLRPLHKTGGRNNYGRITNRFRGGGHKRMYRIIDFRRDKKDVIGKVVSIEYDPNRSARIALIEYADKERRYIIHPLGLNVGDEVITSANPQTEIKVGNCMPLSLIPVGNLIHNVELTKGKGGQIVRGAGSSATITAKEGEFAHVRLPSSEVRLIKLDCCATIGQVGNIDNDALSLGKAGRSSWLGRKSNIRGLAMNPVDHPHGGGEGKSGQGNPHPVSPWGQPTKGYKTRRKKKYSNKYIIKHRR